MCGIYGILGTAAADRAVIERMGSTMRHRGPDDSGYFADGNFGMGMQRLAIIDVEHGQQPMFSEDGEIAAICNGEIYNFRELRHNLREMGHRFATESDSEVVVHLYEEFGPDCVKHLNGMFGLAIWDKRRQRLIIARDRLGIKPLYYSADASRFVFASELKSIIEAPGIRREIETAALEDYLALGYVPAPLSMIKGVKKLLPGTYLVADKDGHKVEPFWSIPTKAVETGDKVDWASEIAKEIEAAVVSQMVSDVPLGAFLSGGIDSSAVVAYMANNSNRPVKTYSIGFDTNSGGGYYNELPFARRVAKHFATDHHEIIVRPDVSTLMPELVWHLDEPIADAAYITTYLVSKFAREDVTVILSGVGGDELFGGYRRYWSQHLVDLYRRVPKAIRKKVLQPIGRVLPSDRHSRLLDWSRLTKGFLAGAELDADERYERFLRVFQPSDVERVLPGASASRSPAMERAFEVADTDDAVQRLIDVDMQTQLPDDLLALTDRMSMAASLECRVPLLDDRLIDLADSMPSDMKVRGTKLKYALKESLRGVLTDDIIDRKKRGFGAPIGGWFKNELSTYLDRVLSKESVRRRDIFDWDEVERVKQRHLENREDHTDQILGLMNFELWAQMYIDGDTPEAVTGRLTEAQAA